MLGLESKEFQDLDFFAEDEFDDVAVETNGERAAGICVIPYDLAAFSVQTPDVHDGIIVHAGQGGEAVGVEVGRLMAGETENKFSFHVRNQAAWLGGPIDLARLAIDSKNGGR